MIAARHARAAAAGATANPVAPAPRPSRPALTPVLVAAAPEPARPGRRRRSAAASRVVPSAKKAGGGGGGGKAQKKGGGALADLMRKKEADAAAENEAAGGADDDANAQGGDGSSSGPATAAQYGDPELLMDLLSICQSYWKHTGSYLLEGVELDALARALYEAPFVCLAHNRFEVEAAQAEAGAGPGAPAQRETVFTYANRAALTLFEGAWDDVVGMPSRLSADDSPEAQADRDRLLQAAAQGGAEKGKGIVRNYSGWRRSLKGARFLIRDATLFNVSDLSGELWGQAVVFDEYETEDGRKVKVSASAASAAASGGGAGGESLQELEAAVAEQAAAVRALKEAGKGNADPEVAAAVEELKRRKDAAGALAARLGPSALREAAAAAAAAGAGGEGAGAAPPAGAA
jgi:hypothetical protein